MDATSEVELSKMFRLFGAVDGVQTFLDGWSKYIEVSWAFSAQRFCCSLSRQAKVKSIVIDKDHDEDMVQNLLVFKHFVDKLLADAFTDIIITPAPPSTVKTEKDDDKMQVDSSSTLATTTIKQTRRDFQYGLADSFRRGFKQRRNKPAEMLAKHLDKAMRKGQQGRKDEDWQDELDKVLGLYRYTDDKDVFRAFYHRALAKRLLLEKSASDDFEKAMLKKLKEGK